MQKLAEICIRFPVFAGVLILLLVVCGMIGFTKLGLDRYPKIDQPMVFVSTSMPGASPEEMEMDVTDVLEEAINTAGGIDELRSNSTEGSSQVMIQFVLEKDPDVAVQDVRDRVELVKRKLPVGIDPPIVQKRDPDSAPVIQIAVSGPPPLRDVTEYADKILRRRLESVLNVGQVSVIGGSLRQINVNVNPAALTAYGLTATDVSTALRRSNVQTPGGTLKTGDMNYMVRTRGRIQSVEEFSAIPVINTADHTVTLGDVATIVDGIVEKNTMAMLNGQNTVTVSVRKQSGSNTVAVVDGIKSRVEELMPTLPPGYSLRVVSDQSDFIKASIHAVEEHLILGGILAALVVLIFLANLRTTFIAALAIPASIISTFAFIWIMGYTLNTITLLALTLCVGIVIDDAIVVLENIYRYIEEKRQDPFKAARGATAEIGLAVMAITFSLMAVFMPVAFMDGIVGRFMASFGVTMCFAIGVSLIVSFTITPTLSARLIKASPEGTATHSKRGLYLLVENIYIWLLRISMRHRWLVMLICAGCLCTIKPLLDIVPTNFVPDEDQSEFSVSVRAPDGRSMEFTRDLTEQIAADIRKIDGVDFTLSSIGEGGEGSVNQSSIKVALVPIHDREYSVFQIIGFVRKNVLPRYASEKLRTSVAPPSSFGGGGGRGSNSASFVINGPELDKMGEYATAIMNFMKSLPETTDADTTIDAGKLEFGVTVDREKAAALGVSVSDVASTLQMIVGGLKVSNYAEGGEQYDVYVMSSKADRSNLEGLSLVTVPSSKMGAVPLRDVVTYKQDSGPTTIRRFNRQRQVSVSCNLQQGTSQQGVVDKVRAFTKSLDMPPSYTLRLSGSANQLAKATNAFFATFMLAFVFMYLVIAAQFNSWVHPFTILAALPLTVPFALVSLLIFGQSLNIFAMLGILVLFAVVKKNAILQVDHMIHLQASGMPRNDAIIQANKDRLRPILMTTIAFVAGMMPMLIATGAGSGVTRNISSLVVGGQTLSLLLTLLATPVIYSLIDDFGNGVRRLFGTKVVSGQ